MYLDYETYQSMGGTLAEADALSVLQRASDDVDALTFSRIVKLGWDKLTEFQQQKVLAFCKEQAEFLFNNADAVESALTSYAINGVTMQFGNDALYSVVNGSPVSNRALALLRPTGLASQMVYQDEVHPDALA